MFFPNETKPSGKRWWGEGSYLVHGTPKSWDWVTQNPSKVSFSFTHIYIYCCSYQVDKSFPWQRHLVKCRDSCHGWFEEALSGGEVSGSHHGGWSASKLSRDRLDWKTDKLWAGGGQHKGKSTGKYSKCAEHLDDKKSKDLELDLNWLQCSR